MHNHAVPPRRLWQTAQEKWALEALLGVLVVLIDEAALAPSSGSSGEHRVGVSPFLCA